MRAVAATKAARVACLVVVCMLAASPHASAQSGGGAVNIGVLTDLSGLYKDLGGEGSVAAAQMAVEDFGGKVLGQDVRVIAGDHKHDVQKGIEIANRWMKDERVGMIVDLPNSAVALAVQKLAANLNRISITVSGGSTDLTGRRARPPDFTGPTIPTPMPWPWHVPWWRLASTPGSSSRPIIRLATRSNAMRARR
jgi:branched-chain amino acid transport system substrate-binding protein